MDMTGTVVVGVDGSPSSSAAVEYALRDAARRSARLRVVAAAQLPEYWAVAYGLAAMPPPEDVVADYQRSAQQVVDDVVAASPQFAGVPVEVEARAGMPGRILVEAADGAEVLVLGHRGRGALSSAMLGSVGLYCVLHATCPVTIVRPSTAGVPVASRSAATAMARGL
jgi:nucleotide-binding universal stress UspA family protein